MARIVLGDVSYVGPKHEYKMYLYDEQDSLSHVFVVHDDGKPGIDPEVDRVVLMNRENGKERCAVVDNVSETKMDSCNLVIDNSSLNSQAFWKKYQGKFETEIKIFQLGLASDVQTAFFLLSSPETKTTTSASYLNLKVKAVGEDGKPPVIKSNRTAEATVADFDQNRTTDYASFKTASGVKVSLLAVRSLQVYYDIDLRRSGVEILKTLDPLFAEKKGK